MTAAAQQQVSDRIAAKIREAAGELNENVSRAELITAGMRFEVDGVAVTVAPVKITCTKKAGGQ